MPSCSHLCCLFTASTDARCTSTIPSWRTRSRAWSKATFATYAAFTATALATATDSTITKLVITTATTAAIANVASSGGITTRLATSDCYRANSLRSLHE